MTMLEKLARPAIEELARQESAANWVEPRRDCIDAFGLDGDFDIPAVARAILTELREPTEEVAAVGQDADQEGDAGNAADVWQAMIDSILSEKPE